MDSNNQSNKHETSYSTADSNLRDTSEKSFSSNLLGGADQDEELDTESIDSNVGVKTISEPALRRLPKYLHYLKLFKINGRENVSCTYISEHVGVEPTLVRKDLSFTGIKGRPKTGFLIDGLISAIENFLNLNNNTEAFLVGAGNLGSALMGYDGFKPYSLKIVAAFDNNPSKIGKELHGIRVLNIKKMASLIKRMHIKLAILTVPSIVAQEVTDILCRSGIRAIWNFSPISIKTPDDVIVVNENLASSLAVLSHRIQ